MKKQILFLLLFLSTSAECKTLTALPGYKIDPQAITISGISSGAYMAVQMQVAFSKTFSGGASVAGGIFWCAKGDPKRAQKECMSKPNGIITQEQINEAMQLAQTGAIDALENLRHQKVFVYASPKDSIINAGNSVKLNEFYSYFVDSANMRFEQSIKSAHGFPTLNVGNACNVGALPWLLKCNYDGAGEILKTMYGELKPKTAAIASNLIKFSQTDFGDAQTPLYKEGWIYVPTKCAKGESCKLHVALHGCQMNPEFIQDQFARLSGFNDWAESNHLIVLYPQSAKIAQSNPYACWDWFGFTGANYVTKAGLQMSALKKMIERVSGIK